MQFPKMHGWDLFPREAIALQTLLAPRVRVENLLPEHLDTVAGVDVSYERHGKQFFAGVVVLQTSDWSVIEESCAHLQSPFPYVPGLLSFRELPVVLEAFRQLQTVPDAVLVDGQGIAHPRRFGLASHLGLWIDRPTVGCAKTRLCGDHEPPDKKRGSKTPLLLEGREIGVVLTTRQGVKPLYISPGHKVDMASATDLVLRCTTRYRLPEPTRMAHQLANRCRLQRAS